MDEASSARCQPTRLRYDVMAHYKKCNTRQRHNKGKFIFKYVWGFKGSFIKDYSEKEIFKKELHRKGIRGLY